MRAFGIFGLTWLIVWASGVILTIDGLYLAFKEHVLLGILALIVEPAPLVLGLGHLVGHPEWAHQIAQALGLS